MKLACYIDTMNRGGAQRVMNTLVNYFAARGHDVILINDAKAQGENVYLVSEKVKRHYLRKEISGNALIKNMSRIKRLRCIIKAEQPDVVLSFLGNVNKRMLAATIGLPCRKYVSVRNDPEREYGRRKVSRLLVAALFRLADGVVFQTEDARDYFPKSITKKSDIILNPIPDKFYGGEHDYVKCRNVVSAGRFEPQKNHALLMKAFAEIVGEAGEKLIIYGDGPLRGQYETLAWKLNIQDRVLFPGNVSDIEKHLNEAAVFVMSSNYEGLPNALMEAMAAGLPCISTDCPCGGARELLCGGQYGLLTACGDVEDLAEALKRMLYDRDFCRVIGCAARKRAEEFRCDAVMGRWERLLGQGAADAGDVNKA